MLLALVGGFLLALAVLMILSRLRRPSRTIMFFHPYARAGGGGERVLWAAIAALRGSGWDIVVCSGDDLGEPASWVKEKFGIEIGAIRTIRLKHRWLVEARTWPVATLLGQGMGSMFLALEAVVREYPAVFFDTMGYAFTYPLVRVLGRAKIANYTHYPAISSDMLQRVRERRPDHNNAAGIANSVTASDLKLRYYYFFASMYGWAGRFSDVTIVNSSWTADHIRDVWGIDPAVVFPPCATAERARFPLNTGQRARHLISIAQFRPEKDHPLQLHAFRLFLDKNRAKFGDVKLILIGSCRNNDDQYRLDGLRRLADHLQITANVEFVVNASFATLNTHLASATGGIHTMWNEHFGISPVECMAAGVIMIAHNSGGPKMDILTPYKGKRTGFLAATAPEFADAIEAVFSLSEAERAEIQQNARTSVVDRFSDETFAREIVKPLRPLMHQ